MSGANSLRNPPREPRERGDRRPHHDERGDGARPLRDRIARLVELGVRRRMRPMFPVRDLRVERVDVKGATRSTCVVAEEESAAAGGVGDETELALIGGHAVTSASVRSVTSMSGSEMGIRYRSQVNRSPDGSKLNSCSGTP